MIHPSFLPIFFPAGKSALTLPAFAKQVHLFLKVIKADFLNVNFQFGQTHSHEASGFTDEP